MVIIWGARNREKRMAEGRFFCPHCRQEAPYHAMRVSKYFTLYFIPLFPIQKLGEYVRCVLCQTNFKPEVLRLTRQQIEESNAPWKCTFCSNTNAADQTVCLACKTPRLPAPQ
jgi:hypothetical protein